MATVMPLSSAKRSQKPGFARILALVAIFLFSFAGSVAALDPHRKISQYQHTAWRSEDGFVRATQITQTIDGYLWLGTSEGLFRFDGLRFVSFAPKGLDIPSRGFTSLLGSRDGSLWIGTTTGLSRLKDGKLQNYSDPRLRIGYGVILEDRTGTIWVTRYYIPPGGGPLCRVDGDKLHCFTQADGVPDVRYGLGLTKDRAGNLWFGGPVLSRWRPGSMGTTYMDYLKTLNNNGEGVIEVAATQDGRIWATVDGIGPRMGVRSFSGGKWAPYIIPGFDGTKIRSHALFVDKDNSLWVGTENDGLYRLHDGIAEHYGTADGLSGDHAVLFYEDHEGDLWVGTDGGLDKFHDPPMVTYSAPHLGLSASDVNSVFALNDGTVWIGNEGGVDVIAGEKFSHLSLAHFQDVRSLFQDHSGVIWLGTANGLLRYQGGLLEQIKSLQGSKLDDKVNSIAEDAKHNIWALTQKHQLFRITNRTAREVLKVASDTRHTGFMAPDKDGGLWIAAPDGTLTYYRDEIARTITTLKDRYGTSLTVHDIAVDSNATVLTSTNKGLLAWDGRSWSVLSARNGLPCDEIFTAIEDNHSALWLSLRCGYAVLQRTELYRWREDDSRKLQVEVFDRLDGARPGINGDPTQPLSTKSADGRLWFANHVVVQMIDPDKLYKNPIPPPVHIEKVIADHKEREIGNELGLPALTRDVEIDYSALSVAVPQKVLFRYRLENLDRAWQDVGTRRQAFYTNLPPGKYYFRVTASNNSGVWNQEGASLAFTVAPAYYQTTWFRALCVVTFLMLLGAVYQMRVRQLRQKFAVVFDARLSERERIAHELHDTLLQTFQGLIFRLQAVNDLLPEGKAKHQLEQALQRADEAMGEGRSALYDLRSSASTTSDLAQTIKELGVELATEDSASFDVVVEGRAQDLQPIVRDETYRIAREALRNAFSHARANQIETEITYGERLFRLRIRDDGEGIPTKILEEGRPGHYGLAGMRERAKQMGGKVEIWSQAKAGTEIELSVAGSAAYRAATGRSLFRLFRQKAG